MRARLNKLESMQGGTIVIGEDNIFEEQTVIKNTTASALEIGNHNLFEVTFRCGNISFTMPIVMSDVVCCRWGAEWKHKK